MSETKLASVFSEARTYNGYTDKPVHEDTLRALYDQLKWGPTAANSCPARFVFVTTDNAKDRLLGCVSEGNVAKVRSAPVTAIVAADTRFYEEMHKLFPSLPWSVSFSYGKALQKTTIVTWMGDIANNDAAQKALTNRSKANSEACMGTYVKGSCASVGPEGNIEMAGGAY